MCANTPCEDEGGPVTLTIAQEGHSATYSDTSGAHYAGTVCGNTFQFDITDTSVGYSESGSLVVNPEGTATKHSRWRDNSGTCSGTCTDNLARMP